MGTPLETFLGSFVACSVGVCFGWMVGSHEPREQTVVLPAPGCQVYEVTPNAIIDGRDAGPPPMPAPHRTSLSL